MRTKSAICLQNRYPSTWNNMNLWIYFFKHKSGFALWHWKTLLMRTPTNLFSCWQLFNGVINIAVSVEQSNKWLSNHIHESIKTLGQKISLYQFPKATKLKFFVVMSFLPPIVSFWWDGSPLHLFVEFLPQKIIFNCYWRIMSRRY